MTLSKTDKENYLKQVFPEAKIISLTDEPESASLLFDSQTMVELELNGLRFEFIFYSLNSDSNAALEDASKLNSATQMHDVPAIYLLSYASPEKQAFIKNLGLNFVDKTGNAWIKLLGFYVDIQGNKPQRNVNTRPAIRNVFSDKSSLILRLLLYKDNLRIREICRILESDGFSLSPGYVSKIMQSLVEQRYVKRSQDVFNLNNPKALLEDWAYEYQRRNRPLSKGFYYPSSDSKGLMDAVSINLGDSYVFSGLAGVSLVDSYAHFDSIDVFARDMTSVETALLAMGAKSVERGANINIIEPYYTVSAYFGTRLIDGKRVVSDLQLYLDLLCQPIRGLEAAEHLFERHLAKTLRLDRNQI
jgi:hypothetical protein